MLRRKSVLVAFFCVQFCMTYANAAGTPEAKLGIIADQCTACHEVPGYEARWERADINAPSFVEIAQNPEKYPPDQLRMFLQKPHWPMTQFMLSSKDIDDILAFIAGLK